MRDLALVGICVFGKETLDIRRYATKIHFVKHIISWSKSNASQLQGITISLYIRRCPGRAYISRERKFF